MSIFVPHHTGNPTDAFIQLVKNKPRNQSHSRKKGRRSTTVPRHKTPIPRSHEENSLEKISHALSKMSFKFIVAPTPHYFFSSHRTGPHHRLIRAPATTSRLTVTPGPIQAPEPTLTPGNKDTLIPDLTLSPIIAPNFLRAGSTSIPLTSEHIQASSNLRLAVIVPAPNELPTPTILSPTYDK